MRLLFRLLPEDPNSKAVQLLCKCKLTPESCIFLPRGHRLSKVCPGVISQPCYAQQFILHHVAVDHSILLRNQVDVVIDETFALSPTNYTYDQFLMEFNITSDDAQSLAFLNGTGASA